MDKEEFIKKVTNNLENISLEKAKHIITKLCSKMPSELYDISSSIIEDVTDRSCYFLDCLTFFDGNEYYQFFGISRGFLSNELRGHENKRAKSNLWYVFVSNNCTKTLAEMSDEERNNRPDGRTSATDEFIVWYKTNYLKASPKRLSLELSK